METFALYLIKSTVWLTGFLLIYMLFLRNERFFVLNRIYLVFGIVASIVFPLFTWRYTVIFPITPSVDVLEPEILETIPMATAPESFPIQNLLLYFYLTGALYLLFRLIKQTVSVWNVIRQSETYHFKSVKLIRTDRYPTSFSFFSFVFVNPSIDEPETSEIVNHEHEHIRQQHWMDLLLFEILRTMHWFNPASWLYGRLIRQNHEYLADERALQRTSNPAIYRAALLNQMFGGPVISLANSFNYSINKKRFKMMTKTIHSPFRKLKLLLVLPLMAGVFYAFATPEYKFVPVENNDNDKKEHNYTLTINGAEYKTCDTQENSLQSQPVNNVSTTLQSDGKTIKGKVITEDGNPLPGTSIVISGTTTGAMSDANGNFELKVTNDSPVVFSFVGYETKMVKPDFATGNDNISKILVTMKRAIISIDITGNKPSGAQTLPGLVIVDGKEIPRTELGKFDPLSFESMSVLKDESATRLYGEKAKDGVIIITTKKGQTADNQNAGAGTEIRVVGYGTQSAAQPNASVLVRSAGSMSGAKPLYVIDGVVSESQNIEGINPATIQSINVLKGETATQKYGEKAKDGAVEITLKKGQTPNNQSTGTANDIQVVGYAKNQSAPQPNAGVVVRGIGSMSGATPLMVINGVVSENVKMESINPNSIKSINVLKGEEAIKKYSDKAKDGVIEITLKDVATGSTATAPSEVVVTGYALPKSNDVFVVVEEMPEFPGGIPALREYLANAVKYPTIAKENGIQGKVYVNFVVNRDGSVSDAKVARGVDPSLDQEALRVVSSLPKWTPGKQKGEPVRVAYTVPITFSLQSSVTETAAQQENSSASKEVFVVVEQMPSFKGGIEALKAYVASTLKYPAIALENGISGKVYVQFVVSKTGKVTDVKITKGVDPSLDKEALRIVASMPDWIPGMQKGQAVDVTYVLPISFSLPEATSVKEKSAATPSAGQITTVQSKRLIIVPNPASNQATITAENMTEAAKLDVSVFDRNGKRIKAEQKTGPTFNLSISDLTNGTYVISANDGKYQYSGQLVVVH